MTLDYIYPNMKKEDKKKRGGGIKVKNSSINADDAIAWCSASVINYYSSDF